MSYNTFLIIAIAIWAIVCWFYAYYSPQQVQPEPIKTNQDHLFESILAQIEESKNDTMYNRCRGMIKHFEREYGESEDSEFLKDYLDAQIRMVAGVREVVGKKAA